MKEEAGRISYDAQRRERVSGILTRQNKSWGASDKTLANLERLRKGAVAVVTGQQVGLFGGPMFAIYKALTAVKLAEEASNAGIDAVPIFWLATYDHDLAEVNHVSIASAEGVLETLTTPSHSVAGAPVSAVQLGDEIVPVLEKASALLGEGEAAQLLRETYRPGETLGTAFARLYARVFAEWGVIVLDASDAELSRVAEPVYRAAIERSGRTQLCALAARPGARSSRISPTGEGNGVFRTAVHDARRERACPFIARGKNSSLTAKSWERSFRGRNCWGKLRRIQSSSALTFCCVR